MAMQNDPEKDLEETVEEQAAQMCPEEEPAECREGSEEVQDADGTEPEAEEEQPKERKLKWAKQGGSKKPSETELLKEEAAQANDKYARLFAEFDNFRKRTEKEKIARYDMGVKDVVEKILPVLDNFERGFDSVEESDKQDAFVEGMDLVYKQFCKILEDLGVTPIEAVGKEFDPELHNAVMHVDDPEAGENIVVEEFQKGYVYKDQVVRYSMVKVAN